MLVATIMAMVIYSEPVRAQEPSNLAEVMLQANESYEAGDYRKAIENYEIIVASGVENSNVYYNLGNAYFQNGDLGQTILNYRRAQRLEPRDAQIAANLRLARSRTVDQLEISGAAQFDPMRLVGDWLTLGEMSALLLALWLMICIAASLYIVLPAYRRWWGWLIAGLGGLVLLGFAAVGASLYVDQQRPVAVVTVPETPVTEGPGSVDDFSLNFSLHAGAEVEIIDRRLGWRQIALPGELRGWVPTDAIELVVDDNGL
ncbi:MAG: tetratricopeptide repeat protein [Anaerolineae bacterium]|nr:tetratricopeptide repeat protein [Anaerolineae bacterium]